MLEEKVKQDRRRFAVYMRPPSLPPKDGRGDTGDGNDDDESLPASRRESLADTLVEEQEDDTVRTRLLDMCVLGAYS